VKAATSGRTADLSRRHKVQVSASGVVSVTGGKLTTYREMAQDAVDALVEALDDLPRSARRCRTRRLALLGAEGAPAGTPGHLADRYGGEARVLTALIDADPSLGEPLVPGLPYLRAEAVYAVRHEMARTVDDVLARRTRARLQARDATADVAADVAALLAADLGWSKTEAARQAAAYVALVEAERAAPELPRSEPAVAELR
jgi:glycerol-3-phosphate dehydrogenase